MLQHTDITLLCKTAIHVKISFFFLGNPEITWYKGNEVIRESEDFKYEQSGELHRLIIAEVFPEDSGVYRAEASNSTGTTSSNFTLLINGTFTFYLYHEV